MVALNPIEHACIDGRYIIEERVAEGGMGQVYRARHATLGKVFALKIIAPAFAEDEVARARFNQEAKLASEISHPNIISVVDFGEDLIVGAYMVMELVEGSPLVEEDEPPMAIRRALELLAQIADVLEHIHNHGVVHGDVKTDNVLLVTENDGPRRRQVVRLLDFGLAQRMGTQTQQVDGTPQYVAPERIAGAPATFASDIYALGVLGFRLLTGKYPFNGTVMERLMSHVHDAVPNLSAVRGEAIDPAIETLIHRALAKDPAERHASAAAFRYELNAVMDMLAINRRRQRTGALKAESRREAMINVLFESSSLPQAVLSLDGQIDVANSAFAQLLGTEQEGLEGIVVSDTVLVDCVPGLVGALRSVHEVGKALEQRAHVDSSEGGMDLVIWLAPFAGDTVHVLVRVDQA